MLETLAESSDSQMTSPSIDRMESNERTEIDSTADDNTNNISEEIKRRRQDKEEEEEEEEIIEETISADENNVDKGTKKSIK